MEIKKKLQKWKQCTWFFCLEACGGVMLDSRIHNMQARNLFCSLIILLNDMSFMANTLISYIRLFKRRCYGLGYKRLCLVDYL